MRVEGVKKKKKIKTDRTSRQTQADIGHSTPAHRGGHVQKQPEDQAQASALGQKRTR